jgi:hypothetical protein
MCKYALVLPARRHWRLDTPTSEFVWAASNGVPIGLGTLNVVKLRDVFAEESDAQGRRETLFVVPIIPTIFKFRESECEPPIPFSDLYPLIIGITGTTEAYNGF